MEWPPWRIDADADECGGGDDCADADVPECELARLLYMIQARPDAEERIACLEEAVEADDFYDLTDEDRERALHVMLRALAV